MNMVLLPRLLCKALLFSLSSQFYRVSKLHGWIWTWEWYSGSCAAHGRICLKYLRDSESCNSGQVLLSLLSFSIPNNSDDTSAGCKYVGLEVEVWSISEFPWSIILFLRLLFHSFQNTPWAAWSQGSTFRYDSCFISPGTSGNLLHLIFFILPVR